MALQVMASLASAEVLLHDSAGGLLAETSPDLHHRCQQSVDDLLARDLRGEAPQLYADLLDGVSVAPLNGTDDVQRIPALACGGARQVTALPQVRIVYLVGVGGRPSAPEITSRSDACCRPARAGTRTAAR